MCVQADRLESTKRWKLMVGWIRWITEGRNGGGKRKRKRGGFKERGEGSVCVGRFDSVRLVHYSRRCIFLNVDVGH